MSQRQYFTRVKVIGGQRLGSRGWLSGKRAIATEAVVVHLFDRRRFSVSNWKSILICRHFSFTGTGLLNFKADRHRQKLLSVPARERDSARSVFVSTFEERLGFDCLVLWRCCSLMRRSDDGVHGEAVSYSNRTVREEWREGFAWRGSLERCARREFWEMKRSRSYSEGGGGQERSVEVSLHNGNTSMQPRASGPSMSHPQTSLSLASSDGRAGARTEPGWSGNPQQRESPSESASSRETWPTQGVSQQDMTGGQGHNEEVEEVDEEEAEHKVVQRVNTSNRIQPRDIMREGLDSMAQRMREQPDESLEELKADVRDILGNQSRREEFSLLQRLLQVRRDLTPERLMRAHRTQLEIFVALKTGILAFLLPDINVVHTALVDIFFHKTCRNISCRSPLPANDCTCECCRSMTGFCNQCMCVMCSKFDFDANTFRWLGCDVCSHWTHSDCAMRGGAIAMGVSTKAVSDRAPNSSELLFRCRACGSVSELLGWARDVFQNCALRWERDSLGKELDYVRRIFHMADDTRGKHLCWKSQEVLEKMKNALDTSSAIKEMLYFFQDTENAEAKDVDRDAGKVLDRKQVCDRVAEVVREAIAKIEGVAEEKAAFVKKARSALESSDRELKDKRQELTDLQYEKQRKKQQIEELESIVKLKRAEAEMFQFKSDEARREAEGLQRIVSAKAEKVEEEYASRYLKLRLDEAEAERRLLFDKLQGPDAVRFLKGTDPSQMLLLNKIHGLFERVGMVSTMPAEGPSTPLNTTNAGSIPSKPSSSAPAT